jgi:hypothetical protein
MGNGLFVNDLFNGEALGLVRNKDTSSGIFRANLFDSQPLGQTTPSTTTASDDALMTELRRMDSSKTASGGSVSKDGGAAPYSPYTQPAPAMDPYATYGAPASEFPWVPVALIGGAVVLTVGMVAMASGRKRAPVTANRRKRTSRRARRNRRRARR